MFNRSKRRKKEAPIRDVPIPDVPSLSSPTPTVNIIDPRQLTAPGPPKPDPVLFERHRLIYFLERQAARHGHRQDRLIMAEAAALLRTLLGLDAGQLLYPPRPRRP